YRDERTFRSSRKRLSSSQWADRSSASAEGTDGARVRTAGDVCITELSQIGTTSVNATASGSLECSRSIVLARWTDRQRDRAPATRRARRGVDGGPWRPPHRCVPGAAAFGG